MKCKFCGYQSANKQFMVIHIRNNHRAKVESLASARRYSSVDLHDDDVVETLALASLHFFLQEDSNSFSIADEPRFAGGGGSFDGGGASDSYDSSDSSSSSSYSSSDSSSSYSSSDSSSSCDSSSGGSDY